jgi:hypothetical protein
MLGPFVRPTVCNFLSAVRMGFAPKSILQAATSLVVSSVAYREVLCLSTYSLPEWLSYCLSGICPPSSHWLRILFPFPIGLSCVQLYSSLGSSTLSLLDYVLH